MPPAPAPLCSEAPATLRTHTPLTPTRPPPPLPRTRPRLPPKRASSERLAARPPLRPHLPLGGRGAHSPEAQYLQAGEALQRAGDRPRPVVADLGPAAAPPAGARGQGRGEGRACGEGGG